MSWLAVSMTVIFPLLLVVLLVMDLMDSKAKPTQFPGRRGKDGAHHA